MQNSDCGVRNLKNSKRSIFFKLKRHGTQRRDHSVKLKAESSKLKAQSKTVMPDWPARCAAKRIISDDIYLSGKHNFFEVVPFLSRRLIF
jgi:hypothetical protein